MDRQIGQQPTTFLESMDRQIGQQPTTFLEWQAADNFPVINKQE